MALRVENLDAAYGDLQVLWDINLEVKEGEIVVLVGSNGAGKTTLLKTISGLLRPMGGDVYLDDQKVTTLGPDERVKLGISQIPEGRQVFSGMTVRENLMMGAYARKDDSKAIAQDLDWVFELFPELSERSSQVSGTLSGGEQQMCAIGRGLMSQPKFLLVDELSLGLAPIVVDRLVKAVRQIHETGVNLLLVEQDVQMALEVADRGYVIETGRISIQGEAKRLLANEHIKKAYLGI